MKSIITDKQECYICGAKRGLQTHHVLEGIRRQKADAEGLVIPLCASCHRTLHDKGMVRITGKVVDQWDLKQQAQLAWMYEHRAGMEAFRERFGKSYL